MEKEEIYSLSKDIDLVRAGSKLLNRFSGVSKMKEEDIVLAIKELDARKDGEDILDYVDEQLLELSIPTRAVKKKLKGKYGLSPTAANYLIDMTLRNLSEEVDLASEFSKTLYSFDRNIGILSEAINNTISGEMDFDLQTLYYELRMWITEKTRFLNSAVCLQIAKQNSDAANAVAEAAEKNKTTLEELQRQLAELG